MKIHEFSYRIVHAFYYESTSLILHWGLRDTRSVFFAFVFFISKILISKTHVQQKDQVRVVNLYIPILQTGKLSPGSSVHTKIAHAGAMLKRHALLRKMG